MSDPNQPKTVTVTVHGARDLHQTNLICRMDPYVILTMGGNSYTTNVATKGGKTPIWAQTFQMSYAGEASMRFKVMEKDKFTADDYIGLCEVALGPIIYGTRIYNTELPLTRKEGKNAGYLKVTIEFHPKNDETHVPPSSAALSPAVASPCPSTVYPPQVYAQPLPQPYVQPCLQQPYPYASPPYTVPPPNFVYQQPNPPYGVPGYGAPPGYPSPYPVIPQHQEKKKKKKKEKGFVILRFRLIFWE